MSKSSYVIEHYLIIFPDNTSEVHTEVHNSYTRYAIIQAGDEFSNKYIVQKIIPKTNHIEFKKIILENRLDWFINPECKKV